MAMSVPTATTIAPVGNSIGEPTYPATTLTSSAVVQGSVAMMPRQEAGQVLSSKMIGASIYGMANEKIGNVSDLILNSDGAIVGVVVGVGGFLGVGEKNIAVTYASLIQTKDDKGATRYTLQVTEDALKAAPAYAPATVN